MVDTVTNVSKKISNDHEHILERLEQYATDNPIATEYRITSELEAEQLLVAMAAILKHNADAIDDPEDAKKLRQFAHLYKQKVQRNQALDYIRELNEMDQISLFGLKLTVPRIVLN